MSASSDRRRFSPPAVPISTRWGIGLALVTALISGVAIYVNAFAVRQVPDAAVYTTLKNGVAAIGLLALVGLGARGEARALRPRQWGALALLGVLGGSVPFLLFFTGLGQASSPSAAFIHKTMFVWVALLAVPLLGERLGWTQLAALALLLSGQFIVATPTGVLWGSGETLIAVATLLWAIEVIVARRLLATGLVGPGVAAAGRMGFGIVVLVGYLVVAGKLGGIAALSASGWLWVVVTGLLLTGYVATWYAALRRAPATVVTSVLVLGAVITATLQVIGAGTLPQATLLGGYMLMALAVAALVWLSARRDVRGIAATA